ncbi:hypothetical protein PHYSODRAFT_296196 [Phytophthora sojae]|uniref:Uncharacterized protein n=1 Tax=Phytophthora sojae (strain P6497) TaxID=1094619 RepID=G4Z021_PHYSP|nr:hypothetical protein PHYSODRAFT_296196 [Phytophthora sojae]EGZ23961.1 hypothetical protein PHYSODRAFT_296196 [Phytophthora sojae]|eukprot:XP_009519249.1 hypothetical protein PHYSODRAFT_296196 [Phytophthora sojae]
MNSDEYSGLQRLKIPIIPWGAGKYRIKIHNQHGITTFISNVRSIRNRKLIAKFYKLSEKRINTELDYEYKKPRSYKFEENTVMESHEYVGFRQDEIFDKVKTFLEGLTRAVKINIRLGFKLIDRSNGLERDYYPSTNTEIWPCTAHYSRSLQATTFDRMLEHAAFWDFIRAKGKAASVRAFPDSDGKDSERALKWLKEKTGRYYRNAWDPLVTLRGKHTLRFCPTNEGYVAAVRNVELHKISKLCKSCSDAEQLLNSISSLLDYLISDVGWSIPGDCRSNVVAAIRNTGMSIDAAAAGHLMTCESEYAAAASSIAEDLACVRSDLQDVAVSAQCDTMFADKFLSRDHHLSKRKIFADLGSLDKGDARLCSSSDCAAGGVKTPNKNEGKN